jgi:LuxR family transcriptional regulator, maltose regulon positive regulatory protein
MGDAGLPDRYFASLETGNRSLAAGDWQAAFESFQSAVACVETPEALEGLAMAAWWLDDARTLFPARQQAFTLYRRQNDSSGAARMAAWLGLDYYIFEHSPVVANGWLTRARRLLESVDSPSFEHCFLAFCCGHIALENHEIDSAELHAENSIELARQLDIVDFEMLGLALHGLVEVSRGNVDFGMRQLDEAVTAVLAGELTDPDAIVTSCCYLFYACERVRDVKRAAEWCEILTSLCQRWSYRSMVSVCRTHYAGILIWQGDWTRAESELDRATRELLAGRVGWSREGILRMADLRRLQGRLDEAVRLFDQVHDHPHSLLGRAEIAFVREDLPAATDLTHRYLRRIQADDLSERISGLDLLIRIAVTTSDLSLAGRCLEEFERATETIATDPYRARLSHLRGVVAAATGDHLEARSHFEDAIDLFESCGVPFESARSRLELARTLSDGERRASAIAECRAALECFERLGARQHVIDATELLRAISNGRENVLGVEHQYPGLSRRESEILDLISQGLTNSQIAEQLFISIRTVERHVSTIYQKVGAEGKTARAIATAFALEHSSGDPTENY